MNKKAQVTMFIIIGIVFILISSTVLYLTLKKEAPEELPEIIDRDTLTKFVTTCIEQTTKPLADKLIKNAGTFTPKKGRFYESEFYPSLCRQNKETGCEHVMITRQSMETELQQAIEKNINECLDFSPFKREGYDVTVQPHTVKTTITSDIIDVTLQKEILIEKGRAELKIPTFTASIRSNLGKLYDLAMHIVYEETKNKQFDEDAWMIDHGEEVEIKKHLPYPDSIYKLTFINPSTKNLQEMYFSVQGRDTSQFRGQNIPPEQTTQGYCRTARDNNCYANVDTTTCRNKGGEWLPNPFPKNKCNGLTKFSDRQCPNGICNDCERKAHGESWCMFDGLTGSGFDPVGSRHYKQSCINGKIYTTECRDYREGLCTEIGINAMCRDNRWEDCVAQTNQKSCEDKAIRDCYWNEWLYKATYFKGPSSSFDSRRCIPEVPPGMKHWNREGEKLCQVATEQFDCDGTKCPKVWVDSTAVYCYMMGDCGNYFNFVGNVSEGSFSSSSYPERSYVKVLPRAIEYVTYNILPLFFSKKQRLNGKEYLFSQSEPNTINRNAAIWQAGSDVEPPSIGKVVSLFFQGKDPAETETDTLHTSSCDIWNTPDEAQCEKCSSHPWKPCTEYRCRSLGKNCFYNEEGGVGSCTQGKREPPTIEPTAFLLNKEKLKDPSILTLDNMQEYMERKLEIIQELDGYRISGNIGTYDILALVLASDKIISCNTFGLDDLFNPMIQPSSTGNNVVLTFMAIPPTTAGEVPEDKPILELPALDFNITPELKESPEIKTQLKSLEQVDPSFKGINLKQLQEKLKNPKTLPQAEQTRSIQKTQIESMFYKKGNFNRHQIQCFGINPFTLSYKVIPIIKKPELLDVVPPEGEQVESKQRIFLSFDAPIECLYSTSASSGSLQCATKIYDTENGKFLCTGDVNFGIERSATFQCKDQPLDTKKYEVIVSEADTFEVQDPTFPPGLLNETNQSRYLTGGFVTIKSTSLAKGFEIKTPDLPLPTTIEFDKDVKCKETYNRTVTYNDITTPLSCQKQRDGSSCIINLEAGKTILLCQPVPHIKRNELEFALKWK